MKNMATNSDGGQVNNSYLTRRLPSSEEGWGKDLERKSSRLMCPSTYSEEGRQRGWENPRVCKNTDGFGKRRSKREPTGRLRRPMCDHFTERPIQEKHTRISSPISLNDSQKFFHQEGGNMECSINPDDRPHQIYNLEDTQLLGSNLEEVTKAGKRPSQQDLRPPLPANKCEFPSPHFTVNVKPLVQGHKTQEELRQSNTNKFKVKKNKSGLPVHAKRETEDTQLLGSNSDEVLKVMEQGKQQDQTRQQDLGLPVHAERVEFPNPHCTKNVKPLLQQSNTKLGNYEGYHTTPTDVPKMDPKADRVSFLYDRMMELWPEELHNLKPTRQEAILASKYYDNCLNSCPGRPTILVIAESPAKTPKDLLERHITQEHQKLLGGHFHCGHSHLVHSISYGEGWLLEEDKGAEKIKASRNNGTNIFWKLLSCLTLRQSAQIMKGNFEDTFASWKNLSGGQEHRLERLKTKLMICSQLQTLGICLVDVSPVPVFLGAAMIDVKNKKTGNVYRTPVHQW
eukprot:CAMPEP_0194286326 /NCGR_PEP_ID=MMETSP0169-20130528/32302_1 /TAXON_ID=218684 /ORGANISM="Corethron pennatum, Strain L29A3" /LENGTH=510 /DNA_ID=CAMNT_0039032729 /DNA_START=315 /DNA_END=1844 /DNA_ORIENTATION=-